MGRPKATKPYVRAAFVPPREIFNFDDIVDNRVRVLKICVERDVLNLIKMGKLEVLIIRNTYKKNHLDKD